MTSSCRILDADSVATIARDLRDRSAQRIARYLIPLMQNGPAHFIDNAHVRMHALLIPGGEAERDDILLPIVVSDGYHGNSNVCSPYSHYVDYARAELAQVGPPATAHVLGAGLSALGMTLKGLQLDRVVYVNNFLWTTNPWPDVSASQLALITRRLASTYPDHAVVCRSVNKTFTEGLFGRLRRNGYDMIPARRVYLMDGTSNLRRHRNVAHDLKLLDKGPYQVVENDVLTEQDLPRVTRFYRELYLGKYPSLNPQFNKRYFEMVRREDVMDFDTLRKNGQVAGYAGTIVEDGRMLGCVLGYDMTAPMRDGLYRRVIALFLRKTMERNVLLNLSAGAGRFKALRGGVPTTEYDAVYHAHLPPHRCLPWWILRAIFTEALLKGFEG